MTENETTLQAIEACFRLIAEASFPISQHDTVHKALAFLDALHTQVKGPSVAEAPSIAPVETSGV